MTTVYICKDTDGKVLEVFDNMDIAIRAWLITYARKEIEFRACENTNNQYDVYTGVTLIGCITGTYVHTRQTRL